MYLCGHVISLSLSLSLSLSPCVCVCVCVVVCAQVLASGPASLTVDSTAGVIRFTGGACLNAGQGVPRPVCGPSGEKVLPNQIKTAPCSDPTAQGWSIHSL